MAPPAQVGAPLKIGKQPRRTLPISLRRHPAIATIRTALMEKCTVTPPGNAGDLRMVLGVSGGADSLALLAAILAIATNREFAQLVPIVVHINHQLRPDADRDEAFVLSLCDSLGVSCRAVTVHPRAEGANLAAAARRCRYRALAQAADEVDAPFVAVAHHADDQLETMLMRLCRGTGLAGLAALRWVRPIPFAETSGVALIRPLLAIDRNTCESLCEHAGFEWIDDPGNADTARTRARVRHEVIPILKELWPNAAGHAQALAEKLVELELANSRIRA